MSSYEDMINDSVLEAEHIISKYAPTEGGPQKTVISAMRYSLLSGGKRIRPILMKEAYKLYGGDNIVIEPFMAALEMIHTYSLIHDDLPAMDDDEYRRGRLTCHKVYGEAIAILAGDGLLNYAFETAIKAYDLSKQHERISRAFGILARKSGIFGMIGGQVADIEASKFGIEQVDIKQVEFIHMNKTAALLQAALTIGGVLAGASDDNVYELEVIGANIGTAFQIRDDILDVIGDSALLGKNTGVDNKSGKITYVGCCGLSKSQADVERLTNESMTLLPDTEEATFLRDILKNLIKRDK